MNITRPRTTQVKFNSRRTGLHVLDDYLEACEFGDRALSDILSQLFSNATGDLNSDAIQFRVDTATLFLQNRFGLFEDPEEGWVNTDLRMFFQQGTWAPGIEFQLLDMTLHEGTVYLCNAAHTSLATFDATKFSVLFEGIEVTAANTSFNNTGTGLLAQTTQAALAELKTLIDSISLDPADIAFDPAGTNLDAENLDAAIRELASRPSDSLVTTNWTVAQSGNDIVFSFNGSPKARLTSAGDLVVSGNITAYGTP